MLISRRNCPGAFFSSGPPSHRRERDSVIDFGCGSVGKIGGGCGNAGRIGGGEVGGVVLTR